MKKVAERFNNPTQILAFDPNFRLVAVFQSYNAVERITGKKHQSIHKCCVGKLISCLGHYWRELPDDVIIDLDEDLYKLSLLEFDKFIGVDRKVYATNKMIKGEVILESKYNNRNYYLKKKKDGKTKSKNQID